MRTRREARGCSRLHRRGSSEGKMKFWNLGVFICIFGIADLIMEPSVRKLVEEGSPNVFGLATLLECPDSKLYGVRCSLTS
jgi:hypothetical protein